MKLPARNMIPKKEQAVEQSKRANTKRSTVMLESPKENTGNAEGSTRLGEITEDNNLPQWDWEEETGGEHR